MVRLITPVVSLIIILRADPLGFMPPVTGGVLLVPGAGFGATGAVEEVAGGLGELASSSVIGHA
jgi:hypothetical protein